MGPPRRFRSASWYCRDSLTARSEPGVRKLFGGTVDAISESRVRCGAGRAVSALAPTSPEGIAAAVRPIPERTLHSCSSLPK